MLNKLNKQHLSQQEALILNKAADFGIQHYSGGTRNKRLPRILESAKNNWSPSLMLYKLHALYQVEKGPLKDEFSVSTSVKTERMVKIFTLNHRIRKTRDH